MNWQQPTLEFKYDHWSKGPVVNNGLALLMATPMNYWWNARLLLLLTIR